MGNTVKKVDSNVMGAIITAVATIFASILGLVGVRNCGDTKPGLIGKIIAPVTGSQVSRSFYIKGELANIPFDYQVCVALEKDNLIWPMDINISSRDRSFRHRISVEVIEPGDDFSLSLFCLDPIGQRLVGDWFRYKKISDRNYLGLREIKGAVRLDIIKGIKLRERVPGDGAANAFQCKGFSKSGKRCQRKTTDPSGYCWQHKR